jgi:hypothetical protein
MGGAVPPQQSEHQASDVESVARRRATVRAVVSVAVERWIWRSQWRTGWQKDGEKNNIAHSLRAQGEWVEGARWRAKTASECPRLRQTTTE